MNSKHNATESSKPLEPVPPPALDAGPGLAAARVSRVSSQSLFSGANEVEIEHHGALYRLRLTSLGKLILTK